MNTQVLSAQSFSTPLRGLSLVSCSTFLLAFAALLLFHPTPAAAGDSELSGSQRQQIIRDFLAEHPFAHRALPRTKAGIRIEGDKITPSEAELAQLISQYGPAVKAGDLARVTAVRFAHHAIVFEINGGAVKHRRWRDHISIGVGGSDVSHAGQTQTDDAAYSINGSVVTLVLKDDAAALTTSRIMDLLAPVLDFKAVSIAEAYSRSLPPKLAEAIRNHHALVGMDKEMVMYALGRPAQRLRESQDGQEYEEWIYGAPPSDVQFIRFVADKVVRIEEMAVNGEKHIRTQDELGDLGSALNAPSARRSRADDKEEESDSAPTLLRPGETDARPAAAPRDPTPLPPRDAPVPTATPGPN